jgi:hypothetical protein
MTRSRPLAALAATLALAFPSAALADGAGDQQYQDPFGNSQPQSQKHNSTTTTPSQPAPTPGAPSSTTQPQTGVSPASSTSASGQADPAATTGQLPRTGLDLRLVGGLGALLVAGGLFLRRRLA